MKGFYLCLHLDRNLASNFFSVTLFVREKARVIEAISSVFYSAMNFCPSLGTATTAVASLNAFVPTLVGDC